MILFLIFDHCVGQCFNDFAFMFNDVRSTRGTVAGMARRAVGSGAPCFAGCSCDKPRVGLLPILANLQPTHPAGLPRRLQRIGSFLQVRVQDGSKTQLFPIVFLTPKESFKKLRCFGPRRLLGPTCPFSDSNLAPKIHIFLVPRPILS